MYLECYVEKVETYNDTLHVSLQGRCPASAHWRRSGSQRIEMPDTAATRRAYFIGRRVNLSLAPYA